MIEKERLFMLIPFTVIRYRKYIDRESRRIHNQIVRKDLTEFLRECIMILNRQVVNGTMTQIEYRDITEMLWKACIQLFKDEELIGEVHENMKSIIRLTSDDLRDALRENEDLLRKNQDVIRENREITQSFETGIHNIIIQCKKDGKSREETSAYIRNIFALAEEETKEKMGVYWEG